MSRRTAALLALPLVALLVPSLARAQAGGRGPFQRSTSSVATPAVSLAAPGGASAVEVNPAALGFLEAWGLLYVHADAQDGDPLVQRGDALYFGAPLPLGLAIGGQIASLRPTGATGVPGGGLGTLAFAASPDPRFAVGTSFRFLRSDRFADRHFGWDLAVAARPSSHVGLTLTAHDLNALADLTPAEVNVESSFVAAVATRPFGTDVLTLEAAGGVDTDGRLGARGMVGVAVPRVGQLRGVVEADDLSGDDVALRVIAGLDVRWGGLSVAGGPLWGDDFQGSPGWFLSAGLSGARREGIPQRRFAIDVVYRGELGPRRLLELERDLDRARHDDRVAGVLLRLRGTDLSLAHAQEIRWHIARLEEAGKPVVCQLETASGAEYYACAEASRTLLDPAGVIRLMGPSLDVILIGELLEDVGIRADFVRIGKYKSAPEQLTRSRPTEPATEQRRRLLDAVWERLVADLATDWDVGSDRAAAAIDRGPYAAPEAREAGLVAGAGDDLDLRALGRQAFHGAHPLRERWPTRVPDRWGRPGRVGVVVVDGTIISGKNVDVPLVDLHLTGERTVTDAIERMARDPSVRAIVLRVDSPGGSALASDKIWRAVRKARKRKPVVASMGAVAASGGYYVASAADEIWADPSTITGSIGIYFGKVDVAQLADRIGVHAEQLSRGAHAGAQSIWRPYTDEEREALRDKIRIWYRMFLRRVAEGRGMEVAQVDAVGRGRVWTGDEALRLGLVDHLGGFGAALDRARRLGGLPEEAGFTVVPFRPSSLLEHVVGRDLDGEARSGPSPVPAALRRALGWVGAYGRSGGGLPMALDPRAVRVR